MKLLRRHLVDAISAAAHGDHIRLELRGEHCTVVGADMYTMTVVELSAVGTAAPVVVTLPTKLLTATCKALQGDDVDVDISTTKLRLRSGGYRGEVAAQGRLPGVQAVPDEMWRELEAGQALALSEALRAAVVAALSDLARPTVSGVRIEVVGNSAHVVGTDGNRLHVVELRNVGLAESLTLPTQCVGAVCEALDEAEVRVVKATKPKKGAVVAVQSMPQPPRVRIAVGANNVAVEVVYSDPASPLRRLVFCRRAPEPYSEWRRVAAGGAGGIVLRLQRDVLLAQLRTCPADAVSLCVADGRLRLDYVVLDDTSTRRLGEGSVDVVVVSAPTTQQPVQVKVSTALLRDAVAQCGDVVDVSLAPSQPVRLRSGAFSAVVMFVR